MKKSSIEIIKRIINYAICILVIHLGCNLLMRNVIPINIMQELKDNIFFSIAVAFLTIYWIFIKGIPKEKRTTIIFGIEVLLLAWTIDIKFMIFSVLVLIFAKDEKNKQENIINKNIEEYFKNKRK